MRLSCARSRRTAPPDTSRSAAHACQAIATRRVPDPACHSRIDDEPYRPATLADDGTQGGWTRWELPWDATSGNHTIRVRATDERGTTQPDAVPFHEQGYLYSGIVPHAVTVG